MTHAALRSSHREPECRSSREILADSAICWPTLGEVHPGGVQVTRPVVAVRCDEVTREEGLDECGWGLSLLVGADGLCDTPCGVLPRLPLVLVCEPSSVAFLGPQA